MSIMNVGLCETICQLKVKTLYIMYLMINRSQNVYEISESEGDLMK